MGSVREVMPVKKYSGVTAFILAVTSPINELLDRCIAFTAMNAPI